MTRYVTRDELLDTLRDARADSSKPTPPSVEMEDAPYRIYRLCACGFCNGTGKIQSHPELKSIGATRCKTCRGEGKNLSLLATATDAASVGVALVTLAEEDEFDGCPMGLMFRPEGQPGKWLVKPWPASPRNISDAGKLLRSARTQ